MEEKPADVFEKSIMAAKRGASAYEVWQGFVYIAAYEIAASCNQDCSAPRLSASSQQRETCGKHSQPLWPCSMKTPIRMHWATCT